MNERVLSLIKKGAQGKLTADERSEYIERFMSIEEKQIGKPFFEMDATEELEYDRLHFNNGTGTLKGYDCHICKNKGEIMVIKDGVKYYPECTCMPIRRSLENMRRSGLGSLLTLYTFDNYKITSQWQSETLSVAKKFTTDNNASFFLIGGQSGAGKSHVCTAISGQLLKQGLELHYMLWLDESAKIKQVALDQAKYSAMVDNLKNVSVLYIDDFFKTDKSAKPTAADVRLANEIINYRYNKCRADKTKRFVTIISTELSIQQLNEIDSAITGRIVEMAKPNYIVQVFGSDKNYRLK